MKSLVRKNIEEMAGYTPGEQPREKKYIKLNTNENPYPPSPKITEFLKSFDPSLLRLYPDPVFSELRQKIASLYHFNSENIIVGNGSDDILTIAVRTFTDQTKSLACFAPSYSLYPVLAKIQDCPCKEIMLDVENGFSLPINVEDKIKDAALVIICRPNAPTGNCFPLDRVESIIKSASGFVLIDEAYAEFADDNAIPLVKKYNNVGVMRTLSKSYSLAGLRLGYLIAHENIIENLMKVKDSYNVGMLAQKIAIEALSDQNHLLANIAKIRRDREFLIKSLRNMNFRVFDSQSNFVLAEPPGGKAKELYQKLKEAGILVRYFPAEITKKYVRITIGTHEEIEQLLDTIPKCLS
ncbi:MAG: histidinol-phosphate transaminase [Candidatus Nanoarchaeia archaeon]